MVTQKHSLAGFVKRVRVLIPDAQIELFGSRASNKSTKWSDYDIIVISDYFENMHWFKRIEILLDLWDLEEDLDILPYTKKEYEVKQKEFSFFQSLELKSL